MLCLQTALSAYKWQLVLASHGPVVRYRLLLKNYFIAGFFNLFLPSSFGGDVYRVVSLRHHVRDPAHMTSSVLFDRISGLLALITISAVSYVVAFRGDANIFYVTAYALPLLGFVGCTSLPVIQFLEKFRNKVVSFVVRVAQAFRQYRRNSRLLAAAMGLSFVFQLNIIFIVSIYCMALGVDLPFSVLAIYVPLIFLTEVVPISINGLGVRETAFVFFFGRVGVSEHEATAVALVLITMRYAVYLVAGGGLFLFASPDQLVKKLDERR